MRNLITILICVISITSLSQEIYSKYPCDSSLVYDILMSRAMFSGEQSDTKHSIQSTVLALPDFKKISGSFFVKFIVGCDGKPSGFEYDIESSSLKEDVIINLILELANGDNWIPAVHRETRVPHRIRIGVIIKKGKVKELYL